MEFQDLFPTFLDKCTQLHELLQAVCFMLLIVGTIVFVTGRFSAKTIILHFVRLLFLMALVAFLPSWGNQIQSLLQNSVLSGLGVDPAKVQEQYNALLVVHRHMDTLSWWDLLGNVQAFTTEALITGLLWLLGLFASMLLFWAYVFQKFILFSGYALSPLLIGFMAIPALRAIGSRYLLHIAGVLLWPVGWATAALITQGILDFMKQIHRSIFRPYCQSLYCSGDFWSGCFGLLDHLQHGGGADHYPTRGEPRLACWRPPFA